VRSRKIELQRAAAGLFSQTARVRLLAGGRAANVKNEFCRIAEFGCSCRVLCFDKGSSEGCLLLLL
jgi:hypothetical protein